MDGAMDRQDGFSEAVNRDRERSLAVRAWQRMRQEPSLMFTVAYLFASCIGLWANYWFYRRFNLPILEYMHAGDYLVAGLRDPAYALVMLAAVAIVYVVAWPDSWRRTHPERVERLRTRWWGRVLFPNHRLFRWSGVGLAPETGIVLAALWGTAWATVWYVEGKADYIRQGSGQPVVVTLAGEQTPRPGEARLLGTGGAFVFIWWLDERRAEAIPVESIGRLRFEAPRRRQAPAPTHAAVSDAPATAPASAGNAQAPR